MKNPIFNNTLPHMNMIKMNFITSMVSAISMTLLLLTTTGCRPTHSNSESTPSTDASPISVTTVTLKNESVHLVTDHLGTVQSAQHAKVPSRLNANVISVEVKVGDHVNQGDALVRLDDREWKAALDQAKAESVRAKADWTRYQTLLKERSVTQREADQIRTAFESAQANLEAAATRHGQTSIKAPFDGAIERIYVEAGEGVGVGQSLVAIEQPGRLEVRSHLPMHQAVGLKIGKTLTISFQNEQIPGTIAELSNVADPQTRTIEAILEIASDANLRPGAIVRVGLPSKRVHDVWIPTQTILRKGQLEFVFLVKDSKASMRLIKSGNHQSSKGLTQVLSGIKTEDVLITSPIQELTDGVAVVIDSTKVNTHTPNTTQLNQP